MLEDANSPVDVRAAIFLIEEDTDAQRPVKRHLRVQGYRVLAVLDLEDALDWGSFNQGASRDLKKPVNKGGKMLSFKHSFNQRKPI